MAKANPSTITLKSGGGDVLNTREAVVKTGVTITPGFFIDLDGNNQAVLPAAGVLTKRVAIERQLVNPGGVSDDYTAGQRMFYRDGQHGDEYWAWLASGQNVSSQARLYVAATGHLTGASAGAVAVAQALEAKNASGAAARIRVTII